jgi:Glyoxalase-like domain
MLSRIDHAMICVPDLQQGMEAYTRLGFHIYPGGAHTTMGTHNAIAFLQDDYLELLSVRDTGAVAGATGGPSAGLLEFLARGGGFRYVIVQSDDLAGDVAAMRTRGVEVSGPAEGGRRTPSGQELRWKVAHLGPRNPLTPTGRYVWIAPTSWWTTSPKWPRPTAACSACRCLAFSVATSSRRTWPSSSWGRPASVWPSRPKPAPPPRRLPGVALARSNCCTARAAWTPPSAG